MRAFCWASGLIGFGRSTPKGALPIAHSRSKNLLHDLIEVQARHGWKNGVLLVPGVPEAPSQVAGLQALERFITHLAKVAPIGVAVYDAVIWPVDPVGG